jgi:hypothetical protein
VNRPPSGGLTHPTAEEVAEVERLRGLRMSAWHALRKRQEEIHSQFENPYGIDWPEYQRACLNDEELQKLEAVWLAARDAHLRVRRSILALARDINERGRIA